MKEQVEHRGFEKSFIIYFYFYFLYCVDVENCRSFRDFSYTYIYIVLGT